MEFIGTVHSGYGIASKMDYPTINVKMKESPSLGVYTADSEFGHGILIVTDNHIGEYHVIGTVPSRVPDHTKLRLTNVTIIKDPGNGVVHLIACGAKMKKYEQYIYWVLGGLLGLLVLFYIVVFIR